MSHGHGIVVIRHGGRVALGKAPPEPPAFTPGSPEHIKQLRLQAAKLIREVRGMPRRGVWTQREWNNVARLRGQTFLTQARGDVA